MQITFSKTREVKSPERGTSQSAGIDFFVPKFSTNFLNDLRSKNSNLEYHWLDGVATKVTVPPGERILIPSGIKVKLQNRESALIAFNKSGVATKLGLSTGACVVDSDYMGEIHLSLFNNSNNSVDIIEDQKIIQFIEMPIYISPISFVDESDLYDTVTERGDGGFGHTDKK